jgi:GntR family transcriptional regulator/MocR family aminotransferase
MRREYRRRRAHVLEALGGIDRVNVKAMDGGLHAVVESSLAESDLLIRITDRGVVVAGLADYWSRPSPGTGGVVLGYGGVTIEELSRALAAIAAAVRGELSDSGVKACPSGYRGAAD